EHQAAKAPHAAKEGKDGSVIGGPHFPACGSVDIDRADLGVLESRHVDEAEDRRNDKACCNGEEYWRSGEVAGDGGAEYAGECANDHCPSVVIDRTDDRHIVDGRHLFAGGSEHAPVLRVTAGLWPPGS